MPSTNGPLATPTTPEATRAPAAAAHPAGDAVARLVALHAALDAAAPLANGRAWLGPLRAAGMARFALLGLPTPRDEAWRKTNLAPVVAARFHAPPAPAMGERLRRRLAELLPDGPATCVMAFVDGHFAPDLSALDALPDGVTAVRLAAAAGGARDLALLHLGRHVDWEREAFAALNTAFMADGALVHLAPGTRAEAPIHIVHLATAPAGSDGALAMTFPRALVVAGAGSSATVVETFAGMDAADEAGYLVVPVTEIVVEDGAVLAHVKHQDEGAGALHLATLQVHQAGPSTFGTHAIDLGGRLVRNYAAIRIDAEGCETLLHGAYLVTQDHHVDNHTYLDHMKPNCHSYERYKGILDDRATAVFTGRIKVHQDAQKTDAVQENSAVLLSQGAMVSTQPQLEIFADDVKCTHGATVGELADDQLLYLRARGIPEAEARAMLTFAFANEVVASAPEAMRPHLEGRLRARLSATTHAAG